ncbi:putative serine/threonine-protein kinase-like protein CCR3 [Symbiodinium microadriaticum]|uniref:non-specific serine/threonine protein kinase n=1 Tax=Symbiodinium microadriaticum TaxID=2951 RepID=A0A1Q9CJT1_SYMMI|nr:putative serine/threonine-protein kinase-like protein CCR3 [Symbiodinium microadriaticum]
MGLLPDCRGGNVLVLNVDPQGAGACPASWQITTGTAGNQVCVRSAFPSSSTVVDTSTAMKQAGNVKGRRIYDRIFGTAKIYQKGSTDAFETGVRDSSGIDSSDYVDGMSVTIGSPRLHIFTLALGTSYDTALGTGGMCPCDAVTQSAQCGGDPVPGFLSGEAVSCDSGTLGTASLAWGSRLVQTAFDVAVSVTSAHLEVRLMSDAVSTNEDVGVLELLVYVEEIEDNTPPQLTLLGSSPLKVEVESVFSDPGATCVDDIDGVLNSNITVLGYVNTSQLGEQDLLYICEDSFENSVNQTRRIVVLDSEMPVLELVGETRVCLEEGVPYVEQGATCTDAVDGTYPATIAGNVDPDVLGNQSIFYSCSDSAGNNVTVARTITVVSSDMPGNLFLTSYSAEIGGVTESFAPQVLGEGVNPATDFAFNWSGEVAAGPEFCRFISVYESLPDGSQVLVKQYEGFSLFSLGVLAQGQLQLAQGSDASLSAGLKDATSYIIVLDELLVFDQSGYGNARQSLRILTGDYSPPILLESQPPAMHPAWPLSAGISFLFAKPVLLGNASLRILDLGLGVEEEVPCDGSLSTGGLSVKVQNSSMQILGLDAIWQPCAEFLLTVDAACVLDVSPNTNPFPRQILPFATSCVIGVSPARNSLEVSPNSPLTITFSEPIEWSSSNVSGVLVQIVNERELRVGPGDWPYVYILEAILTVDLACVTKYCAIHSALPNVTARFSSGLCSRLLSQQCRGKLHQVLLESGTLDRANGSWPLGSVLNGTVLPAQLLEDPYYFTLEPIDATAPQLLAVDVALVSESQVNVLVSINEGGHVYCAAWELAGPGPCTSDVLLVTEYSNDVCNQTQTECRNCEAPSFGCFDRSSMWVDDGCSGRFLLEGIELDCQSSEKDATIHDAAFQNVISLGHRHACALRKTDGSAACWGKSDYIDPVTFAAPAGTFVSIAAGYLHTCAIREGGDILCWGTDVHGETAGPGTSDLFEYITSGYRFSCALKVTDRRAVCWGLDDSGQATPPAFPFLTISAGYKHACGIRLVDNAVVCWGLNDLGQATPPAGEFLALSDHGETMYQGSLSAGWFHTCAVQMGSASILCWGDNSNGQTDAPEDAAQFLQVVAGRAHTCGLQRVLAGQGPGVVKNGTVRCWGLDDLSQSSPPVSLPKIGGIAADDDYTCGLAIEDGLPFCWGKNDFNQADPPAEHLGLPDEFENVTCETDTTASSKRIKGLSGVRDASDDVPAYYSPTRGCADGHLSLTGLREGVNYGIYCTAEDDEVPIPNIMSDQVVAAAGRAVTMPDRTPPTLSISRVDAGVASAVLEVLLSEPGLRVCCVAVLDQEPVVSAAEILKVGTFGHASASGTVATVRLEGLLPDTEYDAYCVGEDLAGNWGTDLSILQSKRDFHVMRDLTPPQLLSTDPISGSTLSCAPDGVAAGCLIPPLVLRFDEDIFRGIGNITAVCLNNPGICVDVVMQMEVESSQTGTSAIVHEEITVNFAVPLSDASNFKVVIDSGALQDMAGNPVSLSDTCQFWVPAGAEGARPDTCAGTFTFWTPS